jgi:oligopeptide transport system ATP-binding protein
MAADTQPLLELRDLSLVRADAVPVYQQVSFAMMPGEVLSIVGESGSGKSQLLLSLLGLAMPDSRLSGSARFLGNELVGATPGALQRLRGSRIAMLFQDPMSALNPFLSIRQQMVEVLEVHRGTGRSEAMERAQQALADVELPDPVRILRQYPHELSGGMRQRVMLAMALLAGPSLLLADEPTTALDVTTQARVLDLLLRLGAERGLSILLVTHDLGVVARMGGRAMVLQQGRMVESGPARELLTAPRSAYGAMLLAAVRRLEQPRGRP